MLYKKHSFLSNRKKLFFCSAILLTVVSAFVWRPELIIPIYKFWHVKYTNICKNTFERRFSNQQLVAAITHARTTPWVQQQITEDLAPFKAGITTAQVATWFDQFQDPLNRLVKFTVVNGKVSFTSNPATPEAIQSRAFKTVYAIIELLAKNGHIQDCEFIVATNDFLVTIPTTATTPAAIFTFAKHTQRPIEKTTILIPDWMNTRYWDNLRNRILLANKIYPWAKKKPLLHWRGGLADGLQHRQKLIALKAQLAFLDVGMTEGQNKVPFVQPENSLAYKYQIALDGARCTWERMVWQMTANTVLIKPRSPHIQWFHKGLEPYVNYVPINEVDAENIQNAYSWLQNNDQQAQIITKNANAFAKNNFKTQDFFAYYALLLQEYAKLFHQPQ